MATVTNTLPDSAMKVYHTYQQHGPLTDYELGYAYRLTHGDLDQSWSGLRTRRCELVRNGLLRLESRRRNDNGRLVGVYAAAF